MTQSVRSGEPIRRLGGRRDRSEKGPLVAVESAWALVADELGPVVDSSFRRLKNDSADESSDLFVETGPTRFYPEQNFCFREEYLSLDEDEHLFQLRRKGEFDWVRKWASRVPHLDG